MLKTLYTVYHLRGAEAPRGGWTPGWWGDHYPTEDILIGLLKGGPKGFTHITVERVYSLA